MFSLSFQSAMSKNCIKLLCEDPVFAEYIKCILMDERTFLNNNIVYTFLTHFLLKVWKGSRNLGLRSSIGALPNYL